MRDRTGTAVFQRPTRTVVGEGSSDRRASSACAIGLGDLKAKGTRTHVYHLPGPSKGCPMDYLTLPIGFH